MLFRYFSSEYGWTPDEIASLTMAQVACYLQEGAREGISMTQEMVESLVKRVRRRGRTR